MLPVWSHNTDGRRSFVVSQRFNYIGISLKDRIRHRNEVLYLRFYYNIETILCL